MDHEIKRQHQELASGRWKQMSLLEQMANIGSEVERALVWKAKNNTVYCRKAVDRALELLDLSLENVQGFPRLREMARIREALVDYFLESNHYRTSESSWRKYFLYFAIALRRDR